MKVIKGSVKVILGLVIVIAVVIAAVDIARYATLAAEDKAAGAAKEGSAEWMSQLSDELLLSEITIPGTHDSATQNVFPAYFLKCQSSGIADQLSNGYRYLDMRLAIKDDGDEQSLKYIHNFATCKRGAGLFTAEDLTVDMVLSDIYAFLDEHPSETVIFCVKAENGNDDVTEVWSILKERIIAPEAAGYFYTENRIPTLGEVRGRIVLATRFALDERLAGEPTGLSLHWSEQNNTEIADDPVEVTEIYDGAKLYVQDRYKYAPDDKIAAAEQTFREAPDSADALTINFLSTSGSGAAGHPKAYAGEINAWLLGADIFGDNGCIVVVDFATEAEAEHIYRCNL